MASVKRVTLEAWIRESFSDTDKEGPCTTLSLVHMIGLNDKEIHSRKIVPASDPKDLADLFRKKAETYAQDLPGTQTFKLLAFYGGRQEPEAELPFRIHTNDLAVSASGGLLTEGPTQQGLMQQMMRWTETVLQLTNRKDAALSEMMLRFAEMLSRRNEAVTEELHDALDIARKLIVEQGDKSHAQQLEILNHQRSTEERRKWLSYVPVLTNTVTGREVFPQQAEDTALIGLIAENIKEEQIGMLSMFLPPEVAGPLVARFERHLKAKREAEEARRLAAKANPDHELEP